MKNSMSPTRLYPIVSFSSISPQILEDIIETMKNGTPIEPIKAFEYSNETYILEGNYEMLAANILKLPEIEVEILDRKELPFWKDDNNLLETLRAVSISTLYDFEEIGGFVYAFYPPYYGRE